MKQKLIRQEIPNDGLTPIQVYRALGGLGCCILESAHEQREGKTSLIGIHPIGTFQAFGQRIEIELHGEKSLLEKDPYEALKKFTKGRRAFGFVSYDAVRLKETLPDRHPKNEIPDLFFHLYQTILLFDHDKQKILCSHEGTQEELNTLLQRCFEPIRIKPFKTPKKISPKPDLNKEEFAGLVEKAKEYIKAGAIFQVVLSRTLHAQVQATPFEIYRALRQTSPSPYHFFFEEKDFAVAGASPELLISIQEGEIESMPIAGTYSKESSAQDLLMDSKECAEHVMLVDLSRNDVGAIALAGSVRVADYKVVKSFSHVNHIVSRVIGKLDASFHPLDALKVSIPAGTLSGAPKIRAMEIIDELENSRRGLYGGAIVAIDESGNLKSCIAIRMAFIQGSHVEVRVGAGIVLDSKAEKEAEETEHKARGVVEALELAQGGVE
jgi:anthranilate synthase component 1